MILEITLGLAFLIALIAFFSEYIDSTLGMGYGTMLTPILLLFGFEPLQVVPSILLSELVTGLLAAFAHHSAGNVDFKIASKSKNPFYLLKKIKQHGIISSYKKGTTMHLKVALLIALCSIVGTVAAVFLAINLSKFYLNLYIGVLILIIGLFILATINKTFGFSWKKIGFLGTIAAFNKGMSGGGYGPVVVGGQLLSGVDGKNAVAITSLAEGLTCIVGVFMYFITKGAIDWMLAPFLILGAVLSVPLSAYTVKKIKIKKFKVIVGLATVFLGLFTLWKLFA